MLNPNFVLVGVFLQLIGGWSYLVDTLKGKVQPNKVSWLLWAVAPLIAFFAQIAQGVGIQSLTTFIVGFVPLVVFIASFLNKKAKWEISRLDIVCGVLSLVGLFLWYITKVGNIAIIFSILADLLASIPTANKSFYFPESENHSPFSFGVINAVIGLLVIQNWNFESYSFPLYLFFINVILVLLIKFEIGKSLRREFKKKI